MADGNTRCPAIIEDCKLSSRLSVDLARSDIEEGIIASATLIPQPETPAGPSKEDIAKVIEEHRQREARRTEDPKGKTDEAEKDDDAKAKEKGIPSDKPKSSSNEAPPIGIPDSSSSGPAAVKHRQFALHRGIFSMLEREAKAREQGAKAKEVGKGAFFARGSCVVVS